MANDTPPPVPSSRARAKERTLRDRRLPSALAGLLVLVVVTTALAWAFLGLSLRSLESVLHDRVEALALLHTMNDAMRHVVVDVAIRAEYDSLPVDSMARLVRGASDEAGVAWRTYRTTWFTEAETELVDRIAPTIQRGFSEADRLSDALADGDRSSVHALLDEHFFQGLDEFSAVLRELVALQVRVTQDAYELSAARFRIAGQAFLGTVVAACALVLVALVSGRGPLGIPIRRWAR